MGARGPFGSRHGSSTVLGSNPAYPGAEGKDFFSGCLYISEQQAGHGHCAHGGAGQGGPMPSPSRGQWHVTGQRGAAPLPSGWCVLPVGFTRIRAGEPWLVPRVPPWDPPQGPALGWRLACRYPHPLPPASAPPWLGGTARHVGLVPGTVPAICLPPPQTLLPCAHSPPGPPSAWGGHLCPQPLQRKPVFGCCLHPNLTAQHHLVPPPGCQGPHQPTACSPAYLLQPPWAWLSAPGRREWAARQCGAPGSWALGSWCTNCAA